MLISQRLFELCAGQKIILKKKTKGNNLKIMQGRVITFVHCTPPQWDLSTYDVLSWYLKYFLRYALDKNVGRKDGRNDGRTNEDYFYIPRRLSAGDN
jgi:hypothetical protein